jgi:hypothetical protein
MKMKVKHNNRSNRKITDLSEKTRFFAPLKNPIPNSLLPTKRKRYYGKPYKCWYETIRDF